MGIYHKNSILNTRVYDVEFPDWEVKEYSANVIAENLLSQVDDKGFKLTIFDSIIEYTKDDSAIEEKDLYFRTSSGTKRMRKTTHGLKFLVLWKDGSDTWVPLKDMKYSQPIDMDGCSKSRGINKESAFAWWIPYTLQNVTLSSLKSTLEYERRNTSMVSKLQEL